MEHLLIAKSVERAKVAICKARHKRASGAVRCGAVVVVRSKGRRRLYRKAVAQGWLLVLCGVRRRHKVS